MSSDLTPAQSKLLDAIIEARAPIVIEGERRYTLEGQKLHWTTVEALERRGCLVRESGRMVIAEPAAELSGERIVEVSVDESSQKSALALPEKRTDLSNLLLEDDPAARARQTLTHRNSPQKRDESVFGWLYRRLEGLFS